MDHLHTNDPNDPFLIGCIPRHLPRRPCMRPNHDTMPPLQGRRPDDQVIQVAPTSHACEYAVHS